MTDFERKPGGKRNLDANGADPMMELTRLLQSGDSSSNQRGSAQDYSAPLPEGQQDDNYSDPIFAGGVNYPNYNTTIGGGYSSVDEGNYLPEGDNTSYQGENEGTYSGQDGNFWSEENTYPQQQNQYSDNANYYSDTAEGVYEYEPSSMAENSYHVMENVKSQPEQSTGFVDNSNYQADSSQGFDWNDYNAQPQNNQHGQGYNNIDQNGIRHDPAFHEESHYQSQSYSSQNYSSNIDGQSDAETYPLAYEENSGYSDRGGGPSQFINQGSSGQAGVIGEDGEFINSETQYWTNETNDGGGYSDVQSEAPQWTPSFDENEQFANEFGVEPNQGVYRNDENAPFLSNDVAVASVLPDAGMHNDNAHISNLHGGNTGDGIQFNDEQSSYSEGPEFVEELKRDHTARGQIAPPANVMANESDLQRSRDDEAGDSLEQSRPLGAIIAPMRMATQPRSFLGYGQAVAVVPPSGQSRRGAGKPSAAGAKSGFSLSRSNPVATQKSAVEKIKPSNNSSPIGRGVNPFLMGKTGQKKTETVAPTNNSEFEDALNDFNLTIKGDQKKRYKRDSNLKTVRPDQNAVPETQSFDLPPVHFEDGANALTARNPLDQEFSDVLAPGVRDVTSTANNGFVNDRPEDESVQHDTSVPLQDMQTLYSEGAVDASKYDWANSHNNSQVQDPKSGSGKKVLLVLGGLAIVLACVGAYYALIGDNGTSSEPVVIQRDEGDVKVAPPADANANQNNQDQAVYNRVESSNTPQTQQSELIDHSEAPVDLDKVDEQAPSANETSLEPNSVESRVLEATQNSLAVHEVPTVTIRDSNNVNGDDINAIIASQQESVLTPGQSFKDHLKTQTDGQQALPNESLQARSDVASNDSTDNTHQVDGTGQTTSQSENIAASSVPSSSNAEQNIEHQAEPANNSGLASLSANNNAGSVNQLGTSPVTNNSEVQTNSAPQPASPTQTPPASVENSNVQTQVGSDLAAGTFYVQIASQPNRDAAQQSLADLKRQPQINSLIGNHQVVIVAADIPGRGTYYRVRIAANNQATANQLCNQLKDLQVSCFVGK